MNGEQFARLQANLARIEALSARLCAALATRRPPDPGVDAPGSDLLFKAATAGMMSSMLDPGRLLEEQVHYWSRTVRHYLEAQQLWAGGHPPASEEPPKDRRFANPLWHSHPWFSFIRRQYELNAETLTKAAAMIEGLNPEERRHLDFFLRQIIDMFAPTNFLPTNPDALERALETEGESLVRGLENLIRDLEENNGELIVTLADRKAFAVGGNIATTPGSVVYRNHLIELIQYAPTTEKVHELPLVIFPPWINKFYILDLRPQNSLIRWAVGQGFTVFVVSWRNPEPEHAMIGMDDYIRDGFLRAIDEARQICGTDQVNATGYCIAGTTLALTLAHLQKAGEKPVRSASFLTTLTDFRETGEVSVFLRDDVMEGLARQVERDGILSKSFMQKTFSFLRANDLVYGPAIRSYLLGEAPPAFDLLYWNGDATNLPGRMALEYLRGLCVENGFARGEFKVFGAPVKLSDVKLPLFALACEGDHIAPWLACHEGFRQMGSRNKTFVLSQSGHIAGVVNPPGKIKYGHYTSTAARNATAEDWRAAATLHEGSWWPRWGEWLARQSGPRTHAPRQPGADGRPLLGDAPGTYALRAEEGVRTTE